MSVDTGHAQLERVKLSQELSQFLIELAIALHRNAMYPQGHPSLEGAASLVVEHLAALLYDRQTLSIGVARRQLVIEGVATDARNPVLRSLAERLHHHHVGAVVFRRGVSTAEVFDVLQKLAVEPERGATPLGLGDPAGMEAWQNLRLYPLTYEQLQLIEDDAEEDDEAADEGGEPAAEASAQTVVGRQRTGGRDQGHRSAQLWIGLAQAALSADGSLNGEAAPTEPAVVARAINTHPSAQAYDQVIVGYLLQIAQELRSEGSANGAALKRRMSRLVSDLNDDTLQRLVEMGGDTAQRRKFLLDATDGFSVDAVVEIVKAAATASEQTISTSMFRMLSKLAAFAGDGNENVRRAADAAVREQVRDLIGGWKLMDPNPGGYTRALESISRRGPSDDAAEKPARFAPDAIRVVQMGLEVDAAGAPFRRAVDALLANDGLRTLVELMRDAGAAEKNSAVEALRLRLATPDNARALLDDAGCSADTLNELLDRMAPGAMVAVLLDCMSPADARAQELRIAARLRAAEDELVPLLLERLGDDQPAVRRKMLAFVQLLELYPPGFSPVGSLRHADASVRYEALLVGVEMPGERERSVCMGLMDKDERVFRAAVNAARAGVPDPAVALIARRLGDDALSSEQRVALIHLLGPVRAPVALRVLLRTASRGKSLLGRARLQPKSPEMLVALANLARMWAADGQVAALIAHAKRSRDDEIRAAASGTA